MAVTRNSAVITEDVALRANFVDVTGQYYNPFEISQVRILNDQDAELLVILPVGITEIAVGVHEVVVPKGTYPTGGVYQDEWTVKLVEGGANETLTGETTVLEVGPKIRHRSNAVVYTDTMLITEFRNSVTGALFDPTGNIQKVEILDSDGVELEEIVGAGIVKIEVGVYRVIADGANLDTAGTYSDKWSYTHDNVAATVTNTFAVATVEADPNARGISISVVDTSTSPSILLAAVDVLVVDSDGKVVLETATDTDGKVAASLVDGTYVVSLRSGSYVFDKNNTTIVTSSSAMVFQFEGSRSVPPFGSTSLLATTDMVTATIQVANIDGTALARRVLLTNLNGLLMKGSTGIFGSGLTVITDVNGKAQVSLVKGLRVGVSVEGFPGSRTITVPTADFNLLTQFSAASDGFDVFVAPTELVREAI